MRGKVQEESKRQAMFYGDSGTLKTSLDKKFPSES